MCVSQERQKGRLDLPYRTRTEDQTIRNGSGNPKGLLMSGVVSGKVDRRETGAGGVEVDVEGYTGTNL